MVAELTEDEKAELCRVELLTRHVDYEAAVAAQAAEAEAKAQAQAAYLATIDAMDDKTLKAEYQANGGSPDAVQ